MLVATWEDFPGVPKVVKHIIVAFAGTPVDPLNWHVKAHHT